MSKLAPQHISLSAFDLAAQPAGRLSQCWIDVFDLPGWGMVAVPALIVRGQRPGSLLFTVAGVHGNEYEGMEAVRQMLDALDPARMHGDFVAILTANPFAYAGRTRGSPEAIDGLNLARIFPGDRAGAPTQRLAAALLELIERTVGPEDLLLDLHSGTAEVAFATMAGYRAGTGPARDRSEEAARHMGLPLLWEIPDAPGPLNAETARRGIATVGTETTGRAGCRAEDVASYQQGLRNLMSYLGICPAWDRPSRDNRSAHRTIDLHAPASGFLRMEATLLADVREGQRLGVIIDPFGEPLADIASPSCGSVWAVRETPHVDAGDLIFMLAER